MEKKRIKASLRLHKLGDFLSALETAGIEVEQETDQIIQIELAVPDTAEIQNALLKNTIAWSELSAMTEDRDLIPELTVQFRSKQSQSGIDIKDLGCILDLYRALWKWKTESSPHNNLDQEALDYMLSNWKTLRKSSESLVSEELLRNILKGMALDSGMIKFFLGRMQKAMKSGAQCFEEFIKIAYEK